MALLHGCEGNSCRERSIMLHKPQPNKRELLQACQNNETPQDVYDRHRQAGRCFATPNCPSFIIAVRHHDPCKLLSVAPLQVDTPRFRRTAEPGRRRDNAAKGGHCSIAIIIRITTPFLGTGSAMVCKILRQPCGQE